jgi:hypothetical protein
MNNEIFNINTDEKLLEYILQNTMSVKNNIQSIPVEFIHMNIITEIPTTLNNIESTNNNSKSNKIVEIIDEEIGDDNIDIEEDILDKEIQKELKELNL